MMARTEGTGTGKKGRCDAPEVSINIIKLGCIQTLLMEIQCSC